MVTFVVLYLASKTLFNMKVIHLIFLTILVQYANSAEVDPKCKNHKLLSIEGAKECCIDWYNRDQTVSIEQLDRCPLRREVADVHSGFRPDVSCNDKKGLAASPNSLFYRTFLGKNCRYHQGASHCVRSTAKSIYYSQENTTFLSRNQCCYDLKGDLITNCSSGAGTVDKESIEIGALGQNHKSQDIIPFVTCMKAGMESLYFERRPCDGGININITEADTSQGLDYNELETLAKGPIVGIFNQIAGKLFPANIDLLGVMEEKFKSILKTVDKVLQKAQGVYIETVKDEVDAIVEEPTNAKKLKLAVKLLPDLTQKFQLADNE